MSVLPGLTISIALFCASCLTHAQELPGSFGISVGGSFVNETAQGENSILITDNNLTDGYAAGFDLTDAPVGLTDSGPAGSAAFQWGEPSGTRYPHASALWFVPLAPTGITPEQSFEIGKLFYRNGTIKSGSAADWVDLALTISFTEPLGHDPIAVTFGSQLINTQNTSDPIASADIVSLANLFAPIHFTTASGHGYYLELTFQVDHDTLDGTLSTQDQFRVFEGSQGSATLLGRFTTAPIGGATIPEPSTALVSVLGMLLALRRKR